MLLLKYFVYKNRAKTKLFSFAGFKKYLEKVQYTEQSIAGNKNKNEHHFEEWNLILDLL